MKKKDRNVFMDVIDKLFEDMIKEANGQDVTITFTKKGCDAHVDAKGNPVAILVALAGLESQILKKLVLVKTSLIWLKIMSILRR